LNTTIFIWVAHKGMPQFGYLRDGVWYPLLFGAKEVIRISHVHIFIENRQSTELATLMLLSPDKFRAAIKWKCQDKKAEQTGRHREGTNGDLAAIFWFPICRLRATEQWTKLRKRRTFVCRDAAQIISGVITKAPIIARTGKFALLWVLKYRIMEAKSRSIVIGLFIKRSFWGER
jgi:hypothetical protein